MVGDGGIGVEVRADISGPGEGIITAVETGVVAVDGPGVPGVLIVDVPVGVLLPGIPVLGGMVPVSGIVVPGMVPVPGIVPVPGMVPVLGMVPVPGTVPVPRTVPVGTVPVPGIVPVPGTVPVPGMVPVPGILVVPVVGTDGGVVDVVVVDMLEDVEVEVGGGVEEGRDDDDEPVLVNGAMKGEATERTDEISLVKVALVGVRK